MLAGYYTDPETGKKDDVLTYYRFNISNAGEAQSLQRNYCYRASIKGVNRRGDEDESVAYNATSPIFKYDIGEEWDTDDDNVVTDNEGNFLVVSKSLLTFRGDQSGADVVKLTVNTSEDMTWEIKMDPESESEKYFQFQKIQEGPGEKIKAFTCGPKQINTSEFYYEGSLTIIAKNEKTGKELRKEVRLVQLTTNGDIKCLVVNDYTSNFTQEVSMYGQTISYKVITGNPTNEWTALDVNNTLTGWSDRISYNGSGTNGNYFTITFPANVGEPRSIDFKFVFDCGDEEANKMVKPITVTFTQNACAQPLTIDGWPSDGELTLNCFNTEPGYKHANCVAQSREFRVRLQKPDDHYFTVTSTFDKYRDLTLSDYDALVGSNHEIYSIHPQLHYCSMVSADILVNEVYDDSPQNINQFPHETDYSDDLGMRTSENNTFFINAFRMGPGDTTIEGKITVQVKDKITNENIPNGKLELTVKLVVPADEYMLNDVMIKNNLEWIGTEAPDESWVYVMDRNIGCKPRMYSDDSGTYDNKSQWCYLPEEGLTDAWKITNMTNDPNWLGRLPLEFPYEKQNNAEYNSNREKYMQSWKNELKDKYAHLGIMYKNADDYPWNVFTNSDIASLKNKMCVSKGRYFLISDDAVNPVKNGKKIKVCCWLPSGCNTVYAYSGAGTTFDDYKILLTNKSCLSQADFWQESYGYWHNYAGATKNILVRLMYIIGHSGFGSTPTLPKDSINDQIEYYKNHILQCFGNVKFE